MARIYQLTAATNNKGLLLLALLSGLLAAVFVFVAVNKGGGGNDSAGSVAIATEAVVATQDIAAGAEISLGMVQVVDVPDTLLVSGAFTDVTPLLGQKVRYPISKGEQLTQAKVGAKTAGDGLAFVVPNGKRALSVQVDEIKGVGGLLLPGDKVDVIAVLEGEEGSVDRAVTVLQNIEVLAVAQKAQEPVPPADTTAAQDAQAGATSGQTPEDSQPQPDARTVTLALSPAEAQFLALIQESATVWLSLRPFGEDTPAELGQATLIPLRSQ